MDDDDRASLRAQNEVLRVAVKHPNLLQRQAFQELSEVLLRLVPAMAVAALVPDREGYRRIHALSSREDAGASFGALMRSIPAATQVVFGEGRPYFCDDTRAGSPVERGAAKLGVLSLVAVPIRIQRDPPRVLAELVFSFAEVGGCRSAPAALLQAIADLLAPSFERSIQISRERRLAMILDTSGDAMLAWDREGRITDANRAATSLTGRPREELIGMLLTDLLGVLPTPPGSDPPTHGIRLELYSRAPGGRPRRMVVAATITSVDDDPLVAAHALLRDLSQVVEAEAEAAARLGRIHELEEQHRTLLDNAPLIIFRLDPRTGELRYLNRHAERLLGVPTAEALSTPGFLRRSHVGPDGIAAFDAAVERAFRGAHALYEARLCRRDGDEITARGTVYPLLSDRGEVAAIEGVLADVSAEHAARTRLVQTDRLSTLGMLAAGVAHEINNPAAFILLGLDMLDRLLKGPGVHLEEGVAKNVAELVGELRDSIRRIVDIARDLRLFASPPAPEGARRALTDVSRTVDSALSLTRGQIIERAQIVRDLDDVPPVEMEGGRLGQVIVNLLVNAAQAIPRGEGREHQITVSSRSDGETVVIQVSDTGAGIGEENLARIWQPFFTTKSPDVGTGLGLSISRDIIERAGGRISVESPVPGSDPPAGARFVIRLPAAGRAEARAPSVRPPPRAPASRLRVLVVEDEAPLARALAEELGRLHDITLASGGEAALELLAGARFDAVLCDLRMPGMSGEDLYERVLERDPAAARRFVFMTGVGFGADVERFLAASGRPLLEKPFPSDAAHEAILRVASPRSPR